MKTTKKELPEFKNEMEERKFWEEHDSTDYLNWEESQIARFPKLKPTTKSISIRLPQDLIDDLKILANKRDVPYQSLLKVFLAEKIEDEFGKKYTGPVNQDNTLNVLQTKNTEGIDVEEAESFQQ